MIYQVIVLSTPAISQDDSTKFKSITISLGGMCAVPLGDFYYNNDPMLALGINGAILYHPRKANKFFFGFGLSYLNYGIESYTREVIIDSTPIDVKTIRNYNIYFPYFDIRIMPWQNMIIVPVFDFFIGPRGFNTVSSYSSDDDLSFLQFLLGTDNNKEVIKEKEFKNWSWGYGFSVGANAHIGNALEFEALIGYVDGGETEFIRKGDISRNYATGNLDYQVTKSDSDMITLELAIKLNLF